MKNLYKYLVYYLKLFFSYFLFNFYIKREFVCKRLGNKGADWWIPTNFVKKNWIVYSGGVGEDISFDLELMRKYKVPIFAFDPTPRAIKFAKLKTKNLRNFHFYPWGLWNVNQKTKFFSPQNKTHVSHSIVNLQRTKKYFWAECKTIDTIMKKLKHQKIDLFKIDIEGAEYAVLEDMLKKKIYPKVLCIEFDQPTSIFKIYEMIRKLLKNNYLLIKQDYFNFTFIKK